jgi:two-component system nitrate/nitrite response regulator NarL
MEIAASTVVVCDQQLLFSEAFAQALRERGRQALVVSGPQDVLEALERAAVTAVVMDLGFPHGTAAAVTMRIRSTWPDTRVVCLGERIHGEQGYSEAGGTLVLSKKQPLGALVEAALRPLGVRTGLSSAFHQQGGRGPVAHSLKDQPLPARFLTRRERDVLRLLASAESTSGIAEGLGISVATTRGYIQSTFIKLGVHSRVEAVTYAVRHRVVET